MRGPARSSRADPTRTARVDGGCRSPPGPTSRSRRRSPRPVRPGWTASSLRRRRRLAAAGSAPTSATRWTDGPITWSRRASARRQGQRVIFARDLINTLRRRDIEEAATKLSGETGLAYRPSAEGEHVSGVYRQRVTLSSGRFAMIDDGMGFQLVPWRPALEQQLGRQMTGVMVPGGTVDWSFGRKRGIGI